MEFYALCWNPTCKRKFKARDKVPGRKDYICPKCGHGTRLVLFTRKQMERGVRFEHLGSGEVVDTRYQRRHVDFRFKKIMVGYETYYVVEMQRAGVMRDA